MAKKLQFFVAGLGRFGISVAVTFAGRPKSQIKYPKENIVIG